MPTQGNLVCDCRDALPRRGRAPPDEELPCTAAAARLIVETWDVDSPRRASWPPPLFNVCSHSPVICSTKARPLARWSRAKPSQPTATLLYFFRPPDSMVK